MKKIIYFTILILFMLSGCAQQTKKEPVIVKPPSEQKKINKNAEVKMADLTFSPDKVTITKDGKVTWTNNDSTDHTVTANDGEFDSGTVSPGNTYSFTFKNKGTFDYKCTIHPSMTGTIEVK